MKHRLFGRSPEEMRTMCMDWYVQPLAEALFERDPGLHTLTFAIGAYRRDPESPPAVGHRWLPGHATSEPDLHFLLLIDEAREVLFGDTGHELDDAGTFAAAFAPFVPEYEATSDEQPRFRPYARIRRAALPRPAADGDRTFTTSVEVVAARQADDSAYAGRNLGSVEATDDAVQVYLEGLRAHDALDALTIGLERLADSLRDTYRPQAEADRAVRDVLAAIETLCTARATR